MGSSRIHAAQADDPASHIISSCIAVSRWATPRALLALLAAVTLALSVTPAQAAVFNVTSTADDGSSGTLRWAINQANANAGSTIGFQLAPNSVINLASNLTPIEASTTINGTGTPGLTINGGGTSAAFFVDSGTVKIENLAIIHANAVGGTGGLGAGGGGGGLGAGGALFVGSSANVTIQNVAFQNNSATGGTGGLASPGNRDGGGGGAGFHGAGGASNPAGGGGGGFAGNGGGAASGLGGAGGGGGEFGNGGNTPNSTRGGSGGGGTNPGQNGSPSSSNSGAAGGGTSGGNGASFQSTAATSGTTGGGGGGGARAANAGNGGLYGGGGGAGQISGAAGAGGDFGGGGGAGSGNGAGGNGGFGGGGGGASNTSGAGTGGFGAGNGGAYSHGGNGGSGYGGAVFVRTGGTLTIVDSGIADSSVTAGVGGTNGSAAGAGIYAMTGITTNLQVNSGTQTYADAIGGAGGINKTGTGALVLGGTNNYTGATTVSAGTLNIDGSITSATTVNSGAMLGGSGTITGDVINNGTVAPGDPTTLTINGSYTQNSAGHMQVQIDSPGTTPGVNSSLLVVNGTANIAGNVQVLPAAGTYAGGSRYIFLEATTLSGTFSGITFGNSSTLQAVLGYGTIGVYQDAFFTLTSNFASVAQTPNQIAVANYIDANQSNPNPAWQDLITTLNSLSPAGVQSALDQMSGAMFGTLSQTQFQADTLELSFLSRRIAGGLVSGGDDDVAPVAANMPAGSLFDSNTVVRGQSSFWPLRRPQTDWNTWATAYGLGGNAQASSSGAAGFNYSLGGAVAGGEIVDGNRLLGVYSGYIGSHLGSSLAGQSANVNSGQLGVYYRKDDGVNYYILLGALGGDGYSSQRQMQFGNVNATALANYGGWQSQVYLERGVTFKGSRAALQPYVALQYLYTRQNSFTETGAGVMDLKVAGIDANSLRSLVGMRLAGKGWTRGDRLVTPVARALWLHEFLSSSTGLNAQFAPIGGSTFAVQGANLGRDWAILGAGLNLNLGNGWQAYANYDAQVNSVQTFHVGSGGVQYSW